MYGRLCILMDYCEGGDLTARISEASSLYALYVFLNDTVDSRVSSKAKRSRKPFPEDQILRWCTDCRCLQVFLHTMLW